MRGSEDKSVNKVYFCFVVWNFLLSKCNKRLTLTFALPSKKRFIKNKFSKRTNLRQHMNVPRIVSVVSLEELFALLMN